MRRKLPDHPAALHLSDALTWGSWTDGRSDKVKERQLLRAAAVAAADDPRDLCVDQIGKFRPHLKSGRNRVLTDVTSHEMEVLQRGKALGHDAQHVHDKSFSKIWWMSQEVSKEAKQMQAEKKRRVKLLALLEDARKFDASSFSQLAIQGAHSAIVRLSSSKKSGSKSVSAREELAGRVTISSRPNSRHSDAVFRTGPDVDQTAGQAGISRPSTSLDSLRRGELTQETKVDSSPGGHHSMVSREGNPKPELVPGGLSGTTGDAQKFQAIAAEVMPDDGVGTAAIAAAAAAAAKKKRILRLQMTSSKRLNASVPKHKLNEGRPKTATGPLRNGWGAGNMVFPERNFERRFKDPRVPPTAPQQADVYQEWKTRSIKQWNESRKNFCQRSDVSSRNQMRLGFGLCPDHETLSQPTSTSTEIVSGGSNTVGLGNFLLEMGFEDKNRSGPHNPVPLGMQTGQAIGVRDRDAATPKQLYVESRNFHEAVPCVYDDLNGTYKVPDKWRVHKNSSSVFGFRDDDLAKRIPADSLARTKPEPRVWKVNQTQPAKPPGPLATDWPLHHRNNLPSTLEIRYLKKVLLPDRRVPPKVIFPRDLRKQADALALSLQQAEEASKPQIPD